MFTSVGDGEVLREPVVPPHIDNLKRVHEEEESDEGGREASVDEFDKNVGPLDEIERLGYIHHCLLYTSAAADE